MNKQQLFTEFDRIQALKTMCPLLAFNVHVIKREHADEEGNIARVNLDFKFHVGVNRRDRLMISYLFAQNGICVRHVQTQPRSDVVIDPGIKSLVSGEEMSDHAVDPKTWEHGLTGILEYIDLYRQTVQQACQTLDGPLNDAYQQLNV